ncbi:MAG TPA: DNA alkylation repair protein [Chloroflexia bacterium]|nr:DNA alkylation repair protein [Chloroflexia bacterium]
MADAATGDRGGWLDQLHPELRASLSAKKDPTYGISQYVATEGAILGVPVPEIRRLVDSLHRRHRGLTIDDASRLLDRCCDERVREEILFATFLLAKFRRQFDVPLWGAVDRWIEGVDNWETCDQLATNIAGELVARHRALVDDLVEWAGSSNRWRRRFAVAATTALNQKGRSDPEATFRVCAPLMADPEPIVQKAVSWTIREVCKQNEPAAFAFLQRAQATAHPRILREASTKLAPAHQQLLRP